MTTITATYGSPDQRVYFIQEPIIPEVAVAARRALRLLPTANDPTRILLAQILRAGALALGYLQLARPPQRVSQQEALARVKAEVSRAADLLGATGRARAPGAVQIGLTEEARRLLVAILANDPAFVRLLAVPSGMSTYEIQVDANPRSVFTQELSEDYQTVLRGLTFPVEVR